MITLSPQPRPSIWLPPESRSSFGVDPDTGAAVFGGGVARNPAGVKITPETALRATVYLACVRVLCETMASLPLYLYRLTPNGKQKAKDHPYYKLFLRRPNNWQTAWEWKQLMVLHLCTYGEAFNEKVLSTARDELVVELVPLAPSRIRNVVETEAGSLRYMFRTETGKDIPYGQDQINHTRWLTNDGLRGMVPVELAGDAIGLARACEIHGAAYFGNGARPGIVLRTPHETIDQLTRDEIRRAWMNEHGGPRRAHRPAVLTGGLEPEIIDGNNQESQFLETRRFQAEEVCRILGVPPHMVGILDRATFSNIEQQGIGYYQQTVLGWAERIEAALTRDVLGEEMADEYELAFDVSRILRGDAAARMTYYHTGLTDGIFSVNEVRELEGMNSVDGGEQRFVGLNMQTLHQAAAASAAAARPVESPPAAGAAVPAESPAAEPVQVADVSLNGAQISGLIAILEQVNANVLTKAGAAAMIAAAFPSISQPKVDAILAGVVEGQSVPAAEAQPQQEPASDPATAGSPDEQRAEPGGVVEGDFVSWGSAGGRARGRVDHVMDYGTLDIPDTDFKIDATEEDPAALITVYEEVSGGWRATDTRVGHRLSALTKIDPLPEPPKKNKRSAKPAGTRLRVASRDRGAGAGGKTTSQPKPPAEKAVSTDGAL
jgi:HK97 family phage portal protein